MNEQEVPNIIPTQNRIKWNAVTWYSKVLAVIMFLLVLLLGFYIGKQYESLKYISSDILKTTFETENKTPVLTESAAKLDTYRNNRLGFSISYPDNWALQLLDKEDKNTLIEFIELDLHNVIVSCINNDCDKGMEHGPELRVQYYENFSSYLDRIKKLDKVDVNLDARDLHDLILNKELDYLSKIKEPITIDGAKGYSGSTSGYMDSGPALILENNGGIYEIQLPYDEGIRKDIISSIKFFK